MVGIWFNHEDLFLRQQPHDDLNILVKGGFTDAYLLIKGMEDDIRNDKVQREYLAGLFDKMKELGLKTHGVFMISHDRAFCSKYPQRADTTISGEKSPYRIDHMDSFYRSYLKESIFSAADEFPMDGIQFDFIRHGIIKNGWGVKDEEIYSEFGLDVPKMKSKIQKLYDYQKPDYNLISLLSDCRNGEEQITALVNGRRHVIMDFTADLAEAVRSKLPDMELSATMMPEGLWPEKLPIAMIHYGQLYEDFAPYFDYLFAMAYAGCYEKKSDWVGEIGKEAAKRFSNIVMGLECTEPRTTCDIKMDLEELRDVQKAGVCFFRYGRMILEVKEEDETLLYNSYPGTVKKLLLYSGDKVTELFVNLSEGTYMRLSGSYDLIRAFGAFRTDTSDSFEGELCVVRRS